MEGQSKASKASVRCAAVDLGASSGRLFVASSDGERIELREAARFETPLVRDASGYQCWDLAAIEAQVRRGLDAAQQAAPLASVGVDSWGVDFALLDGGGRLAAPAVSYRDPRTQRAMAEVLARMPAHEIYRRTGIQFQPFNTLYQLAATAREHPSWLVRARHLKHTQIIVSVANDLQADWQPVRRVATVDRRRRLLAHVVRQREGDVLERALRVVDRAGPLGCVGRHRAHR